MSATERTYEKITLPFWDSNEQPTIKKTFQGEWLVGDVNDGIEAEPDTNSSLRWDAHARYSVARTEKGALAVYVRDEDDRSAPALHVYGDFEELREAEDDHAPRYPQNIIAEVASALGVEHEIELHI